MKIDNEDALMAEADMYGDLLGGGEGGEGGDSGPGPGEALLRAQLEEVGGQGHAGKGSVGHRWALAALQRALRPPCPDASAVLRMP